MTAEIDASRCLVCLGLATSRLAESIVRRVRDLLEAPSSTAEGLAEVHLCNVCRGRVEEIDRLIVEFRQTYQDARVRVVQVNLFFSYTKLDTVRSLPPSWQGKHNLDLKPSSKNSKAKVSMIKIE